MGVAGTFEEKLRRVSEKNVRVGIVHTSYSSFAIVAGKRPKEGRRLWLVLPRGPAKLWDSRAYDEKTKTRSSELAWVLRSVIERGVVSIARLWVPCDCQCECKATFCPPVAAAVTCASNLGIERS